MYNPFLKNIVLEIPKCGSRSLVAAVTMHISKRAVRHAGHMTLTELMKHVSPLLGEDMMDVIAVVRNPEERFESQIAAYMKIKNANKAKALSECARQSHIVFKPQSNFVAIPNEFHDKLNLRLFPIERQHEAQEAALLRIISGTQHRNASTNKLSFDELEAHPLFEDAFQHFVQDYQVYEAAHELSS